MRTFAALVLGAALGLVAVSAARQTATQAPPVFKAGVDIVQVDVSVFDKNRQPVHGLTVADFTILEDGKPQPVAAFLAVDVPDPPAAPVVAGKPITWMRDVAPDVQTNDVADGRLFVMLVDDALIPQDPKIVANARRVAQGVVDRLGPADRMSIVFSQDGRQAQNFTSDKAKLLAAVGKIQAGRSTYTFGWDGIRPRNSIGPNDPDRFRNPHPVQDPDSAARDGSFRTLQLVAEALMAAPQRRKALVYLSPGLPINAMLAGNGGMTAGRTMGNREANVRLAEQMPELFRQMQRADVVVYAIDPCGPNGINAFVERTIENITVMHEYTADIIEPETQEGRVAPCDNYAPGMNPLNLRGGAPACFVPRASDLAHLVTQLSLDFLQTAASNTGGRAIIGTENFDPGIAQIFVENGSYYLLGYRAPPGNKPGTLHRLKVAVNRPGAGVEVRTRSGYYTPEPEKIDPKHPAPSPTSKAIAGLLPSSDLPLQVAVAPVAVPGKAEAAVTMVLGLQRAALSIPVSDTVQVETRAFTPDGAPRGTQLQDAYIAIRPGTANDVVRYEALSSIALKPGRYQLRIAAYSSTNDLAGSVFADVEVPDFAKEPVSLSGVFLTATPAVPASPIDVLSKIVPVVPTAARAFQKLNRVTAFVRAYQGGKAPVTPATLAVRVMNDRGDLVVNTSETFPADRFTGSARSVDYRFEIPMVTLARGPYLLTFEASLGAASARRDIRFSVK